MKKKLLILGGGGYIGKYVQKFLSRKNYPDLDVVVVYRQTVIGGLFRSLKCDLSNEVELENLLLLEQPNYIMNLVGVISSDDVGSLFRVNVQLPMRLFSVFSNNKELKIDKILLIGSASEYGANQLSPLKEEADLLPVSNYGLSKVMQTEVAKYYYSIKRVPVCVARTFNIIGGDMTNNVAIGSFVEQIKNQPNGGVVHTEYLDLKRDFLDIDDICEGYMEILFKGSLGQVYNVCSGSAVSMKDILEKMINFSGKHLSVESQAQSLKNYIIISCGDNSGLRGLGWKQKINLDDSIKKLMV